MCDNNYFNSVKVIYRTLFHKESRKVSSVKEIMKLLAKQWRE